jgi:hypothetical protein
MARLLLLLLAELLHVLLDLPALLHVVPPGVVHRASRITLVVAGGLSRPLVTMWAMASTRRCCNSGGSGCSDQRLVVATDLLLLPIYVFATALSSDICFRLVGLSCF